MSFQIWIQTDKPLQQLATEIREIFSLPPFQQHDLAGESYYQFEMLGMSMLIHQADEEDHDPEVMNYPYSLDLQMSFTDHLLDTDTIAYNMQPYYAQLLAFRLNVKTAYYEKQKVGQRWQIRYNYCCKNPKWNELILYGEEGWEPAVVVAPPSPWRTRYHAFS